MKRYIPIFAPIHLLNETEKAMQTMVTRLEPLRKRKGKEPIDIERAEHLWDKAKEIAKKQGHEGEYAYIMGIWKKMTGYKPKKKTA